jgi:hypothetical protein
MDFHVMDVLRNKFSELRKAPEPPKEIPTNILAFRTITNLLSLIQQERAFQILEVKSLDAGHRQQLKILNALSTVAVIEHEVVAAVNNSNFGTFDLNSNTLELIACVEESNDRNPGTASSKPPSIWNLICSKNYRSSDPKPELPSPTDQPTITATKALAGLQLASDTAIELDIREYW